MREALYGKWRHVAFGLTVTVAAIAMTACDMRNSTEPDLTRNSLPAIRDLSPQEIAQVYREKAGRPPLASSAFNGQFKVGAIRGARRDYVEPPQDYQAPPEDGVTVMVTAAAGLQSGTSANGAGGVSVSGGSTAWVSASGAEVVTQDMGSPTTISGSCGNFSSCQWGRSTPVNCTTHDVQVGVQNGGKAYFWNRIVLGPDASDYASCTHRASAVTQEGGGGGGSNNCGWYTYEISYDGGHTWSPTGDIFWYCPNAQ